MEYKLLVEYAPEQFSAKLNEHLALGWQIAGNHTAAMVDMPACESGREMFSALMFHVGRYDLAPTFEGIVREYRPEVFVDELVKAMRGRVDNLDKLFATTLSPDLITKERNRLWDLIHKLTDEKE